MKYNIITPHGGSEFELERTARSIVNVSRELKVATIVWYVVSNNGSHTEVLTDEILDNVSTVIIDINPIGCRSTARNVALERLEYNKPDDNDFVIFLDSGDTLNADLLTNIKKFQDYDLIIGRAMVSVNGKTKYRRQPSIKLIPYINPIYLGSAITKFEFLRNTRFAIGRKEDWKLWRTILDKNPSIIITQKSAYTYYVKSKLSHSKRKISLLQSQWEFFRSFEKRKFFPTIMAMLIHYCLNIYFWIRL